MKDTYKERYGNHKNVVLSDKPRLHFFVFHLRVKSNVHNKEREYGSN